MTNERKSYLTVTDTSLPIMTVSCGLRSSMSIDWPPMPFLLLTAYCAI